MSRVAIVIVTYNSEEEIGTCLDSLRSEQDVEIVVVDNASTDGTKAIVRRRDVRLIDSAENVGFAGGVNIGVRATTAPILLLLNPDAHLQGGLAEMARHFESPDTGIVGGMLTGQDGKPQTGFMVRSFPTAAALTFEILGINRLVPGNPVNWHYRCMSRDPMTPGLAEQPAGAFLMFSRHVWLNVGGFDERFKPVWFEDVDFCKRVHDFGYRILYEPAGVATHTGGHSVNAIAPGNRRKYWYGNLLEYAARHFGIIGFRVVCAAVAPGALGRAVCEVPRDGFRAFRMYGDVFRLAWLRLFSRRGQVYSAKRQWCVKSGNREN